MKSVDFLKKKLKLIHKPVSFRDHLLFPGVPIGVFCHVDSDTAAWISVFFLVYEIGEEIRMYIDSKREGRVSTDRLYEDIQGVPIGIVAGYVSAWLIDVLAW